MNLITAIFGFAVAAVRGWTLSVLWRWFLVPAVGVAPISVAQAVGLLLLWGLLDGVTQADLNAVNSDASKEDRTRASFVLAFVNGVIALMLLGVGWVVLQFAG